MSEWIQPCFGFFSNWFGSGYSANEDSFPGNFFCFSNFCSCIVYHPSFGSRFPILFILICRLQRECILASVCETSAGVDLSILWKVQYMVLSNI